jgi:hypothetical protein
MGWGQGAHYGAIIKALPTFPACDTERGTVHRYSIFMPSHFIPPEIEGWFPLEPNEPFQSGDYIWNIRLSIPKKNCDVWPENQGCPDKTCNLWYGPLNSSTQCWVYRPGSAGPRKLRLNAFHSTPSPIP